MSDEKAVVRFEGPDVPGHRIASLIPFWIYSHGELVIPPGLFTLARTACKAPKRALRSRGKTSANL
jgi:hypothetical protein